MQEIIASGLKQSASGRIESIDILRGLVMILMAVDHTRDFISNAHFNPTDLALTTPGYFFTRWITHFCAPVFVFLAGTSAFLYGRRVSSKKELAKFLFIRGVWLVIIELTLVRFGWQFNFDYSYVWIQVIWVIGISMITLSGLIYFSIRTIAVFGAAMIFLHNLLDGINAEQFGPFKLLWILLHEEGFVTFGSSGFFWSVYPAIPWIGVMAAGYAFGTFYLKPVEERKKIFLQIGAAAAMLFIVLRAVNIYGDPVPWSQHDSFVYSFMSFLNCEKYPPSLSFLLMTLGPAIISLTFFEKIKTGWKKFVLVFGRTPLFFYIIHVPVIHLIAVLIAAVSGLNATFMFTNLFPEDWPAGFGYGLPGVYIVWIVVLILTYPLCKRFLELKAEKKYKWLAYF